ncbi:Tetrapyrrole biosynthesis, hydroxymethylbilane synthase [Candidatus Omnitrophus magneticus]|uniref:Hydroxymethylbilane synthase n=1 Tax=Candidatus Omnitrophus magneticus TaxID=1609969 RepID=A0A0F0CQE7_9BACT|nr:Tetrapyrrole biosynthesis, hydroxymethylbilane synthase [Candidatus Omnitrophus magneticus]
MCIRIGSRPSNLALKQVEEVKIKLEENYKILSARYRHLDKFFNNGEVLFDVVRIRTKGDSDKITPISLVENTDFFTDKIESALLNGEIDAAIHSAKDLEESVPNGLVVAGVTKTINAGEAFVSKCNFTLENIPKGSIIGTSSISRKNNLLKYRPDIVVKDIRGNIEERLEQLKNNRYDAVIMAMAALIRLGMNDNNCFYVSEIPRDVMPSHPLQGSLAIEARQDSHEIIELFRIIDGK